MQYCSLQHLTLLPSTVTHTTGCCFSFVFFVSSLFLKLFLPPSPVAYWVPTDLGSLSFSVISFCLLILFMGFSRQDYSQSYAFFPVVNYGYESCSYIKKAQHQKCDSFKLGWWRRLFRVLWTVRRSNQSILKETNPEYSLEGLMLKLKLQYFGYLIWSTSSLEKTLMWKNKSMLRAKGKDDGRGLNGWIASLTQWTWIWANSGR